MTIQTSVPQLQLTVIQLNRFSDRPRPLCADGRATTTVSEWPQPTTPAGWQDAVDTAAIVRLIAECRQFGLIKDGPCIDMDLCDQVIEEGRRRGVMPSASIAARVVDFLRTLRALHDSGAAA